MKSLGVSLASAPTMRSARRRLSGFSSASVPSAPFPRMIGKVIFELFDGRMHDKDHLIAVYRAHNAEVRAVIPPDRLLVYHVADGWRPLCDFLGVQVPDGETPKVNSREEFGAHIAVEVAKAMV